MKKKEGTILFPSKFMDPLNSIHRPVKEPLWLEGYEV